MFMNGVKWTPASLASAESFALCRALCCDLVKRSWSTEVTSGELLSFTLDVLASGLFKVREVRVLESDFSCIILYI